GADCQLRQIAFVDLGAPPAVLFLQRHAADLFGRQFFDGHAQRPARKGIRRRAGSGSERTTAMIGLQNQGKYASPRPRSTVARIPAATSRARAKTSVLR